MNVVVCLQRNKEEAQIRVEIRALGCRKVGVHPIQERLRSEHKNHQPMDEKPDQESLLKQRQKQANRLTYWSQPTQVQR